MKSDIYRATYDALQVENIGHYFEMASHAIAESFYDNARPSAVYRPTLTQDGNAWLAVYGDLPTGVVGCGDTPAAAMADFDKSWVKVAVAPPKKIS